MKSIIERLLSYSNDKEGVIYEIPSGFIELRKISDVSIYIIDSNGNPKVEPISKDEYSCILKYLPNSATDYVAVGQYITALRRCAIDDSGLLN